MMRDTIILGALTVCTPVLVITDASMAQTKIAASPVFLGPAAIESSATLKDAAVRKYWADDFRVKLSECL
jgi:hypothetical protein